MEYKGSSMEVMSSEKKVIIRSCDLVLRILGFGLTLVAAVVAGVDRETQTISITLVDTLPPLRVPVTAKWNDLSSSV